jgi:DNA-binding response OmpR family regulator
MPDDARPQVLIIEDEPDMNDLLADILSAYGFEPVQALSGEQGLERLAERPPDAIFLDLMLPGLSGFQICKQLKDSRQTRTIPILILTALDSHPDRRNAYEAGADDYVTKPFTPDALVSRLRECLEQTRQCVERYDHLTLTIEPTGSIGALKAFNALMTCLYCRTDLATAEIEALRKGLVALADAADAWATDRDGRPPVRLSIRFEGQHLHLAFEAATDSGGAFLAEHLAPDAAVPAALTDAGVIDRLVTSDAGVTLEKALPPRKT